MTINYLVGFQLQRSLLILGLVMVMTGCGAPESRDGTNSNVQANDLSRSMVGRWESEGEVTLTLSMEDERVVLSAPSNDTWRMDVSDAQIIGDEIHFVQTHFLQSGEAHPFSGVACNSILRRVDADTLELTISTHLTPKPVTERLTRMND